MAARIFSVIVAISVVCGALPSGAQDPSYPPALSEEEGIWLPERVGGVWEVRALIRPFLGDGGGLLGIFEGTRRFSAPVSLHLRLSPVGVGIHNDAVFTAVADLIVGFDSDYFEAGAGIGLSFVNDPAPYTLDELNERAYVETHLGIDLPFLLRFGSIDGVRLVAGATLVHATDSDDLTWRLGSLNATLGVPLSSRVIFELHGLAGLTGGLVSFDGEIGWQVAPTGRRQRMRLLFTAGWSSLIGQAEARPCVEDPAVACADSVSVDGPSLGVGFQWRL